MTTTIGDLQCQAAVFIYKFDGSETKAFDSVKTIFRNEGPIRGELHNQKSEFLDALRIWNSGVEPDNAFLCIYAHMGGLGLNCVREPNDSMITWQELSGALPRGVQYLWLVGCDSEKCVNVWQIALTNPVRHLLLATDDSRYWLPIVEQFRHEISLNVTFDGDMPTKLQALNPDLASSTKYFRRIGERLEPAL